MRATVCSKARELVSTLRRIRASSAGDFTIRSSSIHPLIGVSDAFIGRQVYPLLTAAGFDNVHVTPRFVYVDVSHPELVDGFTRKTFTAMVANVRDAVIAQKLLPEDEFDAGLRDLERTTQPDGVFCYTFFKGVAIKGGAT